MFEFVWSPIRSPEQARIKSPEKKRLLSPPEENERKLFRPLDQGGLPGQFEFDRTKLFSLFPFFGRNREQLPFTMNLFIMEAGIPMFQSNNIYCLECDAYRDSLFHSVPDKEMEHIHSCKHTLNYQKGEIIFHSNADSSSFYCIMRGSVQLFRSSPTREQSFAIVGSGTWIGYRDALAGIPFQHSARCLSTTTVCRVGREILHEFMNRYPAFTAAIVKDVAEGWVEAERQSYNLGARKTIERLADFLLGLKTDLTPEGESQEAVEIEFPLTRETVATLIGTTTESVIRTLSDFKARGWIEFENGKIRLTNEKELHRLVSES